MFSTFSKFFENRKQTTLSMLERFSKHFAHSYVCFSNKLNRIIICPYTFLNIFTYWIFFLKLQCLKITFWNVVKYVTSFKKLWKHFAIKKLLKVFYFAIFLLWNPASKNTKKNDTNKIFKYFRSAYICLFLKHFGFTNVFEICRSTVIRGFRTKCMEHFLKSFRFFFRFCTNSTKYNKFSRSFGIQRFL